MDIHKIEDNIEHPSEPVMESTSEPKEVKKEAPPKWKKKNKAKKETPKDTPKEEETPKDTPKEEETPKPLVVGELEKKYPPSDIVLKMAKSMNVCKSLINDVQSGQVRFWGRPTHKVWSEDVIKRVDSMCQSASVLLGREIKLSPEVLQKTPYNLMPALKGFYEYHLEAVNEGCVNPNAYFPFMACLSQLKDICISCCK